jgi:ATP-dependent DNA ligase
VLHEVVQRGDCIEILEWTTELEDLEKFVDEWKLEGIVAKHVDRLYESSRRSGAWVKMRLNKRQEFVIRGYTPSHLGLDALLVGFYAGKELRFASAVRAGFRYRWWVRASLRSRAGTPPTMKNVYWAFQTWELAWR